ncbi:hypothetical protein RZS08_01660, partial [Arthrospira platensis SPKY1]|nr:hypothetical protein [Arthrospira platensis SPKY1]
NPSIGPNTISDGTNTWTVLSNAFFSGTFTDTNAPSDATYVVVMRDRAFNYSDPVAFYCLDCIPCAGTPNPGNTLVTSTTPCFGDSLTLSLQNPTSGNIITYQ